jgi:hypothetical protein
MISIKVFGKTCSGAKNSRMGKLLKKFRKWFRKPWSSIYSTKMFLNDFWKNGVGLWKKRSWWFYKKTLVFLCSHSKQLTRATTLPRYGTGLSPKFICFSVGASYYIRVCRTLESGLSQMVGNSVAGSPIGYPSERHLGSPAVAPELRSGGGTAGACRGGKLHRVGTRTTVDRWKALIDYPNPAYLCMMVHGGIPADLSDGVGKVYNLCRV